MKTSAAYQGFVMQHGQQNELLKEHLLRVCIPKKIYLLGMSGMQQRTHSLFSQHGVSVSWVAHYYIMVLIEKLSEQSLNAVQDKIENNLQHFIPVTAFVLDINKFGNWLLKAHPFASAVYQNAVLLYEDDEMPLPHPAQINEDEIKKESEEIFNGAKSKVGEFMAGAEIFMLRTQYKMAAFMLHQAAEQALLSMLFINTGLRVNTHNIDKLLRYCSLFCYELHELFPKSNSKTKKLFGLLQDAYIDTRYRDDYTISLPEAEELLAKVKRIQEVFEKHGNGINEAPPA